LLCLKINLFSENITGITLYDELETVGNTDDFIVHSKTYMTTGLYLEKLEFSNLGVVCRVVYGGN